MSGALCARRGGLRRGQAHASPFVACAVAPARGGRRRDGRAAPSPATRAPGRAARPAPAVRAAPRTARPCLVCRRSTAAEADRELRRARPSRRRDRPRRAVAAWPASASTRGAGAASASRAGSRCSALVRGAILGPDLRRDATRSLGGVPSRARVSAGRPLWLDDHVRQRATPTPSRARSRPRRAHRHAARQADRGPRASSRSTSDGRRIDAPDVNFWGVTFARATRTASTRRSRPAARRYLVEGSVARAHGARDPRERRVPVAVAGRHAHRLQEAASATTAAAGASTCSTSRPGRDAAGREARRSTTRSSGSTTTPALRLRRAGLDRAADGSGRARA